MKSEGGRFESRWWQTSLAAAATQRRVRWTKWAEGEERGERREERGERTQRRDSEERGERRKERGERREADPFRSAPFCYTPRASVARGTRARRFGWPRAAAAF